MRPNAVITIDPGAGDTLAVAGGAYRVLLSGAQTNGACAIISMMVPPHSGPGPHAHKNVQESFYVVEGEVIVRSETQTYTARKGTFINIPFGGAIHNFKNETNEMAHLLCIVSPAGMDDMFKEIGKPIAPGVAIPPPTLPTPELLVQMKSIAEKYGQEFFPPDYFKK
jgi:quercetin dioxygenase-like cupin family protein